MDNEEIRGLQKDIKVCCFSVSFHVDFSFDCSVISDMVVMHTTVMFAIVHLIASNSLCGVCVNAQVTVDCILMRRKYHEPKQWH